MQHKRSYGLHLAEKDDIWDFKNHFRNQIDEIIYSVNIRTESKKELFETVMEEVKAWVVRNSPNPAIMKQPWKAYALTVQKESGLHNQNIPVRRSKKSVRSQVTE